MGSRSKGGYKDPEHQAEVPALRVLSRPTGPAPRLLLVRPKIHPRPAWKRRRGKHRRKCP